MNQKNWSSILFNTHTQPRCTGSANKLLFSPDGKRYFFSPAKSIRIPSSICDFISICFLYGIGLFVLPVPVNGQQLAEADMTIDLTHSEVQIHIAYQLADGERIEQLQIKGIGAAWTDIRNIQVHVQDQTYDLMIEQETLLVQNLMVSFDAPIVMKENEPVAITYRWRKPQDNEQTVTYTIPVLYVDGEAAETGKDIFQVTLITEEEQTVQSIFPAMPWKKDDGNRYVFSMQVFPAWIKFKLYPGAAPFLTLEKTVDFGVLFVLIGFLFFGAQRLKKHHT
ncbi:MAG: hypothetical protein HRU40_22135 [Saprospiraceae bacterium]|nr:hypothetical protein [Saprospiraceae bacterium]